MIITDLSPSRTSSAVPNGLCGAFTAPRHDSAYVSEYYTFQPLVFRELKVGSCVVHYSTGIYLQA